MEEKTEKVPNTQYICDPYANAECKHSNCVLYGGSCFTTTNRDFAGVGADGLPEEATPRKVLEMQSLIQSAKKPPSVAAEPFRKFGTTSSFFDGLPATVTILDPETTMIRKHTHDTLWAVMLGFGACAGLVIGMIIIGVLSYARG